MFGISLAEAMSQGILYCRPGFQGRKIRFLHLAEVKENIRPTRIRDDESEPFCDVEPFVQTLRGDDIADRREAFNARLHVLAQAQDMLMLGATESAGIHDTILRALAPHDGAASRFGINGPEFLMNPKQTLSMALSVHELATNAMKYGALSSEHGRVLISWTLDEAGDGNSRLVFTWREEGGPPVTEPARKGFGSRLISRVLAADFNGEVWINYPPGGVVCELTARIQT